MPKKSDPFKPRVIMTKKVKGVTRVGHPEEAGPEAQVEVLMPHQT